MTPHINQKNVPTTTGKSRRSAIDGHSTRHLGYRLSQTRRAAIECILGWGKQHDTLRKTKHRGRACVTGNFLLNLITYNLARLPKLLAAQEEYVQYARNPTPARVPIGNRPSIGCGNSAKLGVGVTTQQFFDELL